MITAIVLIKAEPRKISKVGEQLAGIKGVAEVYSVSGRFDLVAIIRLSKNEELSDLITGEFSQIEGITHTESMVAFKMLSKYDIAAMFDLGS